MTFNIEEHERKLGQINEKFLEGTMSREDVKTAIAELLGETNLAYKLKEALELEVNGRVSFKAKERLNPRQYFMKREELEEQVIESDFPYAFFQEATLGEIEQLNLDLIDKKTLMWLVIEALKSYVDNMDESNPKCLALHNHYLTLKKALSPEIPFESGDGFAEYLATQTERIELANARETGSVCLACGSHNVRSKSKTEWQCHDCGKRFRKH